MNFLTNMGGPLSWNPAFKDWKRGEQVIHSPWPPSDDVNTPFFSTVLLPLRTLTGCAMSTSGREREKKQSAKVNRFYQGAY